MTKWIMAVVFLQNSLQMKDISTHSESDGENDLYSAHVDDLKDGMFSVILCNSMGLFVKFY